MRVNTIFDFNVSYDSDQYTTEDIKNIIIRHLLDCEFEVEIDAVETYDIPEI